MLFYGHMTASMTRFFSLCVLLSFCLCLSLVCFLLFLLIFFSFGSGGGCNDRGWMRGDREISGVWIHDVECMMWNPPRINKRKKKGLTSGENKKELSSSYHNAPFSWLTMMKHLLEHFIPIWSFTKKSKNISSMKRSMITFTIRGGWWNLLMFW